MTVGRSAVTVFIPVCFVATPAHGETLQLPEGSPAWALIGAGILLWLHIGGGLIGIVTGAVASTARKGHKLHRFAGQGFLISMLVAYLVAAGVAPFLEHGQRPNFVAAILALYLLMSGVSAARRREFQAGFREVAGLVAAVFVTGMGAVFAYAASQSPTGTVDGSPPQAFVIFIVLGTVGLAGEVRVLFAGSLSSTERQKRHLWRMCGSFFIASGSLFLGQPQVFPAWFNATFLPDLFAFAPLLVMLYWLVKLRRRQAIPLD